MEQIKLLPLLILCVQTAEGLIWNTITISNVLCAGSNISLVRNYTLESGEIFAQIEWTKSDGTGGFINVADDFGSFTPAAGYVGRLIKIGNAGIQISNATSADGGTYYVSLTLTSGQQYSVNNSVEVHVAPLPPPSGCSVTASQSSNTVTCTVNGNCGTPVLNANWTTSNQFECTVEGTYRCCATSAALTCYSGSPNDFCRLFNCTPATTTTPKPTGTTPQDDNNTGKIVGGTVGAVIALIVAALLAALLRFLYKKKNGKAAEGKHHEAENDGINNGLQESVAKSKTGESEPKHSRSDVSGKDVEVQMEEKGVKSNEERPSVIHIGNQNRVESETRSKKTSGRPQPSPPEAVVTEDIPKYRPQPPPPENSDVKDPDKRGISANFDDKQGLPTEPPRSSRLPPLTPKQPTVGEESASKEPKKKRRKKKNKGQMNEENQVEEMVELQSKTTLTEDQSDGD